MLTPIAGREDECAHWPNTQIIDLKGCFSYSAGRTRKTVMSFRIGVGGATAEYGGGPRPSFLPTSGFREKGLRLLLFGIGRGILDR